MVFNFRKTFKFDLLSYRLGIEACYGNLDQIKHSYASTIYII